MQEIQVHFQEENVTFAPRRSKAAEPEREGIDLRGSVSESTSSPFVSCLTLEESLGFSDHHLIGL